MAATSARVFSSARVSAVKGSLGYSNRLDIRIKIQLKSTQQTRCLHIALFITELANKALTQLFIETFQDVRFKLRTFSLLMKQTFLFVRNCSESVVCGYIHLLPVQVVFKKNQAFGLFLTKTEIYVGAHQGILIFQQPTTRDFICYICFCTQSVFSRKICSGMHKYFESCHLRMTIKLNSCAVITVLEKAKSANAFFFFHHNVINLRINQSEIGNRCCICSELLLPYLEEAEISSRSLDANYRECSRNFALYSQLLSFKTLTT